MGSHLLISEPSLYLMEAILANHIALQIYYAELKGLQLISKLAKGGIYFGAKAGILIKANNLE